jgi:thiamine biosynthesis lipoprotein
MGRWESTTLEFAAMASPCALRLDGTDGAGLMAAGRAAIAEVRRIEAKYSRYRPDSVASGINRAAGRAPVEIDEETAGLLEFADHLWRLSGGLFDITSGVLRRAWDFKAGVPPAPARLRELLPLVGWDRVVRGERSVRLESGMELDFGGLGKEYAADRAAAVLASHGVFHGLVNLGGDLHALGARGLPAVAGQAWQVAIQHPRRPDDVLAHLALGRGGLATSGDYERYMLHEGRRYCHILDPRNGWPVSHWQSISVLSANTSAAGALSTIAMLKGELAVDWLDQQGAAYLAVRHDGEVARSGAATPSPSSDSH